MAKKSNPMAVGSKAHRNIALFTEALANFEEAVDARHAAVAKDFVVRDRSELDGTRKAMRAAEARVNELREAIADHVMQMAIDAAETPTNDERAAFEAGFAACAAWVVAKEGGSSLNTQAVLPAAWEAYTA